MISAELEARTDRLQETAAELDAQTEELQATTDELQQKTADAEHANRANPDFLASMSHELRTPLSAFGG